MKTLQIFSNNQLLSNTSAIDLEWKPFKGVYNHSKTQVTSAERFAVVQVKEVSIIFKCIKIEKNLKRTWFEI